MNLIKIAACTKGVFIYLFIFLLSTSRPSISPFMNIITARLQENVSVTMFPPDFTLSYLHALRTFAPKASHVQYFLNFDCR